MFRKLIPLLAFVFVVGVSAHSQNPPPAQTPRPAAPPAPAQGQGGRGAGAGQLTVWAPHTVPVEPIDQELVAKIKAEGMERSKVMWLTHYITDTFGARPIGSPTHKASAEWAIKTMAGWGLKNPHLEPFTWRGIGWLAGKASGFMTAPVKANLKFETTPWTPSTNGTVSGEVVHIIAPENPTEAELSAFLANLAAKVKGGIVMVGAPVPSRSISRKRRSAFRMTRRKRDTRRPTRTRPRAVAAAPAQAAPVAAAAAVAPRRPPWKGASRPSR